MNRAWGMYDYECYFRTQETLSFDIAIFSNDRWIFE